MDATLQPGRICQAHQATGHHLMSTPPRSASRKRAAHTSSQPTAGGTVEPPGTRERILNAAVASLIELGTARTTTLEVQRRAEVSRGALLHHFPTHAAMLAATVEELVRRNEAAVVEGVSRLTDSEDGIARAVSVLAMTTAQPAYMAELELWAVSRTDPELLACLRQAERRARKESERVVGALFSTAADKPAQSVVMAMTMEFLRGLALSSALRSSPARRQQLIAQWARAAKILLESLD